MYNTVKKFLVLHHHLVLPGIGNFVVEKKPAQIDFTNRSITSSQTQIIFSNNKPQPEKLFYDFLSDELNIDETQAVNAFTNFTAALRDQLEQENNIYFKGIGTLTKQTSNNVAFQPEAIPEYFPVLTADRVIRKNVTHIVRVGEDEKTSDEMHTALLKPGAVKKEKWWVAATILAAIGIAAIIFYYAVLN